MAFLIAFGIIGLAISFVIGQAASRLVTAFVNDIVDPTVGLFLPAGSLDNLAVNVTGIHGGSSQFKYGDLISNNHRLSYYFPYCIHSIQGAIKVQSY